MLRLNPGIYDQAADLIETAGHAKHVHRDEDGCYCTMGALMAALGATFEKDRLSVVSGTLPDSWTEYGAHLTEYLAGRDGWDCGVPLWNDREATTQADAVALLRDCAADLKREQDARRRHDA